MMAAFKNCIQKPFLSACFSLKQVRYYPRWSHRRPVRVYTPEEYEAMQKQKVQKQEEKPIKPDSIAQNGALERNCGLVERVEKASRKPVEELGRKEEAAEVLEVQDFGFEQISKPRTKNLRKPIPKKVVPTVDMLETIVDGEGNFVYTKMKDKDVRISSVFVNLKSKKSKGSMLLEGKRLIKEALIAGCKLQYMLFSRKDDLQELKDHLPKSGAKLFKLPYKEMQAWSELTTTPGIMAIFKIPDLTKIERKANALPLTVVCDNIREPGNLGAILRTSAGVGCQSVILTKGCTDLWNSKVLRTACGAHFRIPIEYKLDWPEIRSKVQDSTVFIADNHTLPSETEMNYVIPMFPYVDVDYKMCKHITLVIGGETEGISAESYKLATEYNGCRINIPLANDIESLNTGGALGVIAFEIRRQCLEQHAEGVEKNSL